MIYDFPGKPSPDYKWKVEQAIEGNTILDGKVRVSLHKPVYDTRTVGRFRKREEEYLYGRVQVFSSTIELPRKYYEGELDEIVNFVSSMVQVNYAAYQERMERREVLFGEW